MVLNKNHTEICWLVTNLIKVEWNQCELKDVDCKALLNEQYILKTSRYSPLTSLISGTPTKSCPIYSTASGYSISGTMPQVVNQTACQRSCEKIRYNA